jgi:hypothetical protein
LSRRWFTDRDLGKRFPEILVAAGLSVERHSDRFAPDGTDEEWLEYCGSRGIVAISHNERIRYTPNEQAAVDRHRVSLLIVSGKAPFPELAHNFVRTLPQIQDFLDAHAPPFIAKVYAAHPKQLNENPEAPGRIELWYPRITKA